MMTGLTATRLADELERAAAGARDNTGLLSWLDEATLPLRGRSAEIGAAQRAFSQARWAHIDSYKTRGDYSPEAWDKAVAAARRLAALLRPLSHVQAP